MSELLFGIRQKRLLLLDHQILRYRIAKVMQKPNNNSSSSSSFRHIREKQQLSRLLYGNPVCLLTTPKRPALGYHHANAMTISWLTPVDNQGNIFLSINTKRHTAERLMKEFSMVENDQSIDDNEKDAYDDLESPKTKTKTTYFVLNVPIAGQEEMVLRIGGCSGRDVDKFAGHDPALINNEIAAEGEDNNHDDKKDNNQLPTKSFTLCRPGWTTYGGAEGSDNTTAVDTSLSQMLQQPSPTPSVLIPSVEKGKEAEPAISHSVRGHQKSVKAKKKACTENNYGDYDGNDLVAIRECIAHIVCR